MKSKDSISQDKKKNRSILVQNRTRKFASEIH